MLVAVTAVLSFTQPLRIGFNAHGTVTRRAIDVRAVAQDADLKAIDAAASKVRRAAAMFGPEQKTAANSWLDKTIDNGGFSSAALLKQKKLLFEECVIDDDGSSNCLALDDALVDLQTAMTNLAGDKATNTQKLLAQNKVNKAKLAVRAVAAKFGKTQKNQADAWLEQALGGQSADSLFEASLELFGECELAEEGSKESKRCIEMSKALEALRVALGDVTDQPQKMSGMVVPVSKAKMTDMQYRKMVAEGKMRP